MNEQLTLDLQPVQEVYRIALTQGQFALVDFEDYYRLIRFKWQAHWNPSTQCFRAQRGGNRDGKRCTVLMHREIMHAPDGTDVDHRDHDELNNRKANLRLATKHQNSQNKRKLKPGKSGYKGVRHSKRCTQRPWEARIGTAGKISLGYFATREAAFEAYKVAAREVYGEFACFDSPAVTRAAELLEQM